MPKTPRKNMATQNDWSSTVPPRTSTAPPTKPIKSEPPPIPPSAVGPQQVRSYKAPKNELDFLEALRSASEQKIRSQIIDLIECVQLQKIQGTVPIEMTNGERVFVHEVAIKYDVDLRFSLT
jgi:hypothetical protein